MSGFAIVPHTVIFFQVNFLNLLLFLLTYDCWPLVLKLHQSVKKQNRGNKLPSCLKRKEKSKKT